MCDDSSNRIVAFICVAQDNEVLSVKKKTMCHSCYPFASGVNKLATLWVHMDTMTGNKGWEDCIGGDSRMSYV